MRKFHVVTAQIGHFNDAADQPAFPGTAQLPWSRQLAQPPGRLLLAAGARRRAFGGSGDGPVQRHRPGSGARQHRVRGLPGRRGFRMVVPSAAVRGLRAHRLLRLLAEPACERALRQHRARGDPELRAGRGLVLGLPGTGLRGRPGTCAAAAQAGRSAVAEAGEVAGGSGARLDPPAVLSRRDEFAAHWHDDGQVGWLEDTGIDLVRGHGRLAGPRAVTVGDRRLEARHAVVVCTGSRAVLPPIPGLADVVPWTSREATSAHRVPGSLAIIGGGVVGCEMAAAWQALGARVTLLARDGRLLPRVEEFAGGLVARGLAAAGTDVRLGASVTAAHRPADGAPVSLTLDDGSRLQADEVLVAVGRSRTAGSMPPRTSTTGRCSPTWASTRAGSAGTR